VHHLGITPGPNQVTDWAQWNYSGYEGPTKAYGEYRGLMDTMTKVGRTQGCGRAMWEYNANQDRFGTPEALMLLHYFTGGCIDSMEGLLFESSATTPYHFLNQAELSVSPSEPMVGLPYGPLDVPLGVEHLQLLGVRYFMAFSPAVKEAASADPSLRLVATSGPWSSVYNGADLDTTWNIYQVLDAGLVQPLTAEPAVLTGVKAGQKTWLSPSTSWYADPARWGVELASGGPAAWPRVTKSETSPPVVHVAPTTVHGVHMGEQSLSFTVSHIGTPVLVKISYFPNWHVSGAQGPWRVTPNLMVVVPTNHTVTLTYGTTPANTLGLLLTVGAVVVLVGIGMVVVVRRRRDPIKGPGAARHGRAPKSHPETTALPPSAPTATLDGPPPDNSAPVGSRKDALKDP